MVQMRRVVVRGESLHARTDLAQCFFKGLTVQVNPRQAQVVGMPELRIIQSAGMKCFEEIVIIQVSQAGVSAISNCRNQTSPMVSAIRK
jgi:hypothetical protein